MPALIDLPSELVDITNVPLQELRSMRNPALTDAMRRALDTLPECDAASLQSQNDSSHTA
jgi:hypothetical protein